MYINSNWRILTIGDGDLSFSSSLLKHHKPKLLTATIYDELKNLCHKYSDEHYLTIKQLGSEVLTNFDVTNSTTWQSLKKNQFDLIIFQFPLVPAFESIQDFKQNCLDKGISVNTLNRQLLRQFLLNSFQYFLDPHGAQLCYITSKDVKPYREWAIESSLTYDTDINYLGSMKFNITLFPGYQIRNVDRNKHVKDTLGITYVWSKKENTDLSNKLELAPYLTNEKLYCPLCRVGPFMTEQDKIAHQTSKRHIKMTQFEQQFLHLIKKQLLS